MPDEMTLIVGANVAALLAHFVVRAIGERFARKNWAALAAVVLLVTLAVALDWIIAIPALVLGFVIDMLSTPKRER